MRTFIYQEHVICEQCATVRPGIRYSQVELNEEPDQIRESDTCSLCGHYLLEDPDHEDDDL